MFEGGHEKIEGFVSGGEPPAHVAPIKHPLSSMWPPSHKCPTVFHDKAIRTLGCCRDRDGLRVDALLQQAHLRVLPAAAEEARRLGLDGPNLQARMRNVFEPPSPTTP